MQNHTSTSLIAVFALALSSIFTVGVAKQSSPFVGHWQAVDIDGGDMRLTIGGPPKGPFHITWTEGYFGHCYGGAGIVRGTGTLKPGSPYVLEAELVMECLRTGETMELGLDFVYHPTLNTLSTRYPNGMAVVFRRPGRPQLAPAPLGLRVNYGHDWVEGFYAPGHTVWLAVTERDGLTVKATAEVITEPKDFWDGGTGFQTTLEDWEPAWPNIQPYDWVYGWIDNGAIAQVQIGEIGGAIDVVTDSVRGTVLAEWFSEELLIVCDPWGLSDLGAYKFDNVMPDGLDEFVCSWAGELDVRPGEELGVWYLGPDGQWVVNAFTTPHTRFSVFPEWDYVEGWDWPEGATVNVTVDGKSDCSASGTSGHPDWDPQALFVGINLPGGCDIETRDEVTLSDGRITLSHTVRNLAVTEVDEFKDTVTGTSDSEAEVYVWPHGFDEVQLTADADGKWSAEVSTDLVGGMCGRSEIRDEDGNATAVDWCARRFTVFPLQEYIEGWDWLPEGAMVYVSVEGKPECNASGESSHPDWDPRAMFAGILLPEDCDVVTGDLVALDDSGTPRTHRVRNLFVTTVEPEADTVSGTADPGAQVHVWPHGYNEVLATANQDGIWTAGFSTDLTEGMCGRSEIRDVNGNATAVDWCVPSVWLTAFPVVDEVFGDGWPEGSSVRMSINNGEFVRDATVGPAPWNPNEILAYFSFGSDRDLVADDVVTLTGSGFTEEHVVRALSVTGVDAEANTVAGTAVPGSKLHLSVHGYDGSEVETIADGDGSWLAQFSIDLTEGMCGRAAIRDDGNSTAVDWCVPPAMGLRVNYGHDWVESFYEPGHRVDLTVTEGDGVTVKAAATVYTEPKDFWDGATGFQTVPEDWSLSQPDIQPGDWEYASVDNGVTAEVKIGNIQGLVDIESDSITGTINASWLEDPVQVECLDWGSGQNPPAENKDGGTILTNGLDTYSCSWDPASEWDVQALQDIGVGYITPDGHWVANAFHGE